MDDQTKDLVSLLLGNYWYGLVWNFPKFEGTSGENPSLGLVKKNQCCVFRPAFGYCGHPKAGLTTFSAVFNLFCSF